MSNQHNTTASPPWIAKKVWTLPTALVVALVAFLAINTTSVFAQESIIRLDKQPNVVAVKGSTVSVEVKVVRTGANPLTITSITDSSCQSLTLNSGQDVNNNGILDEGDWRYTCIMNVGLSNFNNFATVQALENGTNPVSDSDVEPVTVLNPGVHLTKALVTTPPILQNTNVVFNIDLQNTGLSNIPLANITLTDLQCSVGPTRVGDVSGDGDAILEPDPDGSVTDGDVAGEIWRYTCQINNVINDFVNVASVTAKDANNQTFTHSAGFGVTVLNPGLAITKEPHAATVTAGQPLTWTIKVYNTGSVDMQNVAVTESDPNCTLSPAAPPYPGDIDNDNILDRSEVWTVRCIIASVPAAPSPRSNTATVSAVGVQGGQTYNDSVTASVNVIVPGIQIEKEPLVQVIAKGSNAVFTLKVTNTGQGELSNVTAEDLLCTSGPTFTGGDADNDGKLDPDPVAGAPYTGEIWTYSCTIANVQSDLINIATARAKDAAGNNVTPSTITSAIDVINPSINIDKTPNTQTVAKGGTVNFGISVSTGTGDTALTNVVVTDPLCSANPLARTGGDDGDNVLELGETWTYACSIANVQNDFTNEAFVTAKDPLNNTKSASDKADVDVLTPGLSVEKTPPFQVVTLGSSAAFTIEVRNTGQAALTPVGSPRGVTDALCTPVYVRGDTDNDNQVDTNEVWVFSCNVPALTVALLDDFVNVATGTYNDGAGNQVTDSDRASAVVVNPGIDLEKTADSSTVLQGGSVKFTFSVSNQGDQTLSNVTLTDPLCNAPGPVLKSGDVNSNGKLESTEVWVYECTLSNATASFTNNASVTAKDPNNITVSDTDQASVTVINAQLSVNKSTTTPVVQQGANVLFTIQATNTGAQNLTTVTIADNMSCQGGPGGAPTFVGGDANVNGILNPNETWTWTCTVTNAQADYVNTATVTAKEQSTNQTLTRSDSESVTVLRPGINLAKTPPVQSIFAGQVANFTLLVANTGNAGLTNVQLLDAQCNVGPTRTSGDTDNDNVLDAGETWQYSCTINNVTQNLTNSAAVTANSGAQAVADTDSADVIVLNPSIRIDKTPDQQTVASGGTANFTINVSNPGTAPLSNVVVTDPLCSAAPLVRTSGDIDNDNVLDPGETWVYTCSIANVTQNLVNTASVSASTGAGTVNASDTANVTVQTTPPPSGSLVLAQTVNPATIVKGGSATFQATLANGTATDMTGVSLKGDKCKSFTRLADNPGNNDAVLNSGETWVWQCVLTKVTKTTTNKVTAKITSPKQTLTASIKLTVTSSRGLLIEEDASEVSGVEVLIDSEGKVIDEAQLINKNYLPIVIGEEE